MKTALSMMVGTSMLFGVVASAAEYGIDGTHSNVGFSIRHLVSKVNGEFTDYDGMIDFDPAKPEQAKIKATVKTTSIDTRNKKRDDHLRSPDFFDAKKYPKMEFVSKKVSKTGDNKYVMEGDLTLHGVTKPVKLDVEMLGQGKDFEGKERMGFSAKGTINRKDYGIVWNTKLDSGGVVLGDDVEININLEAVPKAATKKI